MVNFCFRLSRKSSRYPVICHSLKSPRNPAYSALHCSVYCSYNKVSYFFREVKFSLGCSFRIFTLFYIRCFRIGVLHVMAKHSTFYSYFSSKRSQRHATVRQQHYENMHILVGTFKFNDHNGAWK
jgi:hypothetical protein